MTIRSHPGADTDFAEAYDAYSDSIFRHCCYRCFNRERARELMQDTFMKTWDYLAAGNDIDNVQAFLYRTANNLLIDEARRRKKREVVSFEDMAEDGFDIEGEDGRDQAKVFDAKAVAEILYELEEPYRTALIMRYIDELSPKEIAELLNETANGVSVRINRGLKMLRTILIQYG
ncbi:MAG: sigma-70 family RNA polymerase sigma factor [Candidatus Peribacteraceae bacterium]|nr:sigma-70 family RNA polymerase sigma factor [Candidatus Peribacteraceae bacterium]MDP7477048.1 sigma-70 family RNA polymerase sigma factor [Candidatus Peribacteraceae bacterium]